jgi:sugar phosphate permease
MGNWFPKKNRGFIVSMWATTNNFGNIAGIQVAVVLIEVFDKKWQWLMIVAAGLSLIIAIVVWFFLIPHPQDVGIFVEEMTEKELLIASATDKEVYNNVIRQSVASPEEIKNQVRLSTSFRRLSVQGSIT